jgi:predicted aldo/keto reductase-like oxidoreductase
MGVDIPGSFAAYNRRYTESKFWGLADYFMATGLRKNSAAVSNCIGCGKCEAHCPQGLSIRQELKKVEKTMEVPIYKLARKIALWLKF